MNKVIKRICYINDYDQHHSPSNIIYMCLLFNINYNNITADNIAKINIFGY